jgi:hypothetical protein
MRKLIFLIFVILTGLEAQEDQIFSSQEGRYFLVGFMKNEIDDNRDLFQRIFIGARKDTEVTIVMPDNSTEEVFIPAFSSYAVNVSNDYEHKVFESVQRNKLIRIVANNPVSVYGYSTRAQSSDMFTSYPVHAWGNNYMLTSLGVDYYRDDDDDPTFSAPRTGEALIMAAYDNTQININLNSDSRTAKKGQTITIELNSGESYLLAGREYSGFDWSENVVRTTNDLTGTIINSSKPIGVISGHLRTAVPQEFTTSASSKDHLNEILVPTSSWDKNFVTVPLNFQGDNLFKVLAKNNNTNITINSGTFSTQMNLNAKEFGEVYLEEPAVWESDKPIQIMQFMARREESRCYVYSDPAMLLVNPVNSFVNNVAFQTPSKNIDPNYNGYDLIRCKKLFTSEAQYEIQQVTILMDEDAARDIRLDGEFILNPDLAVTTSFEMENKRYFLAHKVVEEGSHFISSEMGKFTIMNYGTGLFDSYAHSTGISIYKENADLDENPPDIVANEDCKSFVIDAFDTREFDLGVFEMITSEDNYNVSVEESYNFSNNGILVNGQVENLEEDASFSATFVDYQGNSSPYSFTYTGIKPELKINSELGVYTPNSVISTTFSIKNNSKKVILLKDIVKNSKISFEDPIDLEYEMQPGEELIFDVLIDSNGEYGKQFRQIIAKFECGLEKSVDFYYEIKDIALDIKGYDFGDVYLDNHKIGTIEIINQGQSELVLDRFEAANNIAFEYDLSEIENKELLAGESFTFSATFTPKDRADYSEQIFAFASGTTSNGSVEVSANDFVIGTGIAPLFNSLEHDFETVWLGNNKSRKFIFENTGNVDGELIFENFENLVSYSDDSQNLLASINEIVAPGESYEFEIIFEPDQIGDFEMNAIFKTNWDAHPEIRFDSRGAAINEIINPIDSCGAEIDSLFDNSQNLSIFRIIRNDGAEPVIISNLEIIEITASFGPVNLPDNRFQIVNRNDIIGSVLDSGEEIIIEFETNVLQQGEYRIVVETSYQDPDPEINNEISISSEVCLAVKEIPNPSVSLDLIGNINASPCVSEPFELSIDNIGNTDLEITELNYFGDADVIFDNFDFPIIISENESAFLTGSLLINLEDQTSISFSVKMRSVELDTLIEFSFEENVDVIPESIYGPQPNLSYSINEEGNIGFEFEFPYTVEEDVECEMTITADPKLMYLTNNNIQLKVAEGELDEQFINMVARHSGNKISFEPEKFTLDISKYRKVNFELPFLFLLINYYETDIEFKVNSERCFLPFDGVYKLELDGNCVYRYRPVESADEELGITINPRSNKLSIHFETPGESQVNVWLTDISGRKVSNFEKKFVNIGEHSLNYDISTLPNGNYFLTFQTKYLTRQRLIIKSN